jgi:hypothetical protein
MKSIPGTILSGLRPLILLYLLLAAPAYAGGPVPAAASSGLSWDRLERGEIVVEAAPGPDGLAGVHAMFLVRAPKAKAWSALVDYPNFQRIYEGIEKMRVLEQSDRGATLEMWVNSPLGQYHYVLQRRYELPGERVSWDRLSGDFERLGGTWDVRDTGRPGVYLLDYRSYAAGLPVPEFLARPLVEARTLAMAERLRAWIEGRRLAMR